MSITNIAYPANNLSVQDSLWHIAASSNSGQTDMKYIFDIYNNGVQLIRVKVFPDPTNGRGYFDASSVLRNEISFDWFTPLGKGGIKYYEPSTSGEVALTYAYAIGEEVSGTATLNLASGTVKAYNYSAPLFKRFVNNISSLNNKFLTNRPKVINAQLGQKLLIPYKVSEEKDITIKVTINGTTYEGDSYTIKDCVQLDIGSVSLNTYLGTPRILSTTEKYTVSIFDEMDGIITDTIVVKLFCRPLYNNINLHFINQWGMFDTAGFDLASKLTMDVERKSFTKKEYNLNTSSVTYYDAYNVYNESKINYGSKANWSYKLTMNYPSDAEYQWLAELITSPQVYAEIDDYYYPVTIKATNYEYSKYVNNQLKTLEIDIEMNQTRFGFRR